MNNLRLLIVDDDERLSLFIAIVARERGWNVETATTGSDFQSRFARRAPHAIVLDLQLGTSDGVEQLRFLQRQAYTGHVILTSGFDARVLASAQELGTSLGLSIAGVLEKPARLQRLRDMLAEIEKHWSAQGEHARERVTMAASADPITPVDVERGIENGEMILHLQPIVTATGYTLDKAEALIRWQHPRYGVLSPDRFIPIVEQDERAIDRLTMWVIDTAIDQHQKLREETGRRVPIAVNVSGVNLHSLDFPDEIAGHLDACGVPADALTIEITESAAMSDPQSIIDILTRLRLKGFELAMDDFGTGYSSLKALRQMPFSEIKIDRSFVADLRESHDSYAIVNSVIDLARNMGLACVAEGVETAQVAQLLVRQGVQKLQGYHFGYPMPLAGFIAWMRDRDREQTGGSHHRLG